MSGKHKQAASRTGARALAQLVPGLIAPAAKRYGFSSADLIGQWTAIVGAEIAARCTPERIAWPRRPGDPGDETGPAATLHLRARAQHVLQVSHETDTVSARVNAYFGYAAIARVVVHRDDTPAETPQAPACAGPPSPEPVAGVEDEGLRSALGELGGHVREDST